MKRLPSLVLAAAILPILPAFAQILPKDAASPLEVIKARGDFAQKLQGAVMPRGKGWKAASDSQKRLQLMLPDKWKVDATADGDTILRATPPGEGKVPTTVLIVSLHAPRDADPLDIDQEFATSYADDLAGDPAYKMLHLTPTDSGFILGRGLKFALGGWSMPGAKKEPYRQEQLIYISEDRIVTIQFTAREKDFPKYMDELAGVFASYQNLGVVKTGTE